MVRQSVYIGHKVGKVIPMNIFDEIIPVDTRRKWLRRGDSGMDLDCRVEIIEASGPEPSDPYEGFDVNQLKMKKAAWETYLSAAKDLGLFDGDDGKELLGRLRSPEPEQFRSGMAECLAIWFLAGKMKFDIQLRPKGRNGKILEFLANDGSDQYNVEVKAPYKAQPTDGTVEGDDSDTLQGALASANRQFNKGLCNLLILVPDIRIPIRRNRKQLVHAFFGIQYLKVAIQQGKPEETISTRIEFDPKGDFVSSRNKKGKFYKPDHSPRYTSVSAAISIEEYFSKAGVEHSVFVVHNPFALMPARHEPWNRFPQLVTENGNLFWTDGKPVFSR